MDALDLGLDGLVVLGFDVSARGWVVWFGRSSSLGVGEVLVL